MLDVHDRMMRGLEQTRPARPRAGGAARRARTIAERRAAHIGLTQPELAVLLAYSKITLYAELLDSDLPEDPALTARAGRLLPGAAARALRRPAAAAPAAARDRRHAGDQRRRRPRRHHVRVPAAGGHGRERRPTSRAPTPSRATCSTCAASGPTSRRSTSRSTPTRRSRCCSRPAAWSSGPRAGCCATGRGRSTSAPRSSGSPPGAALVAEALPGVLVADEREAFEARVARARARTACPSRWPAASRACGDLFAALDIVGVAGATGRSIGEVARAALPRRRPAAACTGCATGSRRCRATTAGRRWRAPRCATTSSASTPSSPPTSCAARRRRAARAPRRAWTPGSRRNRPAGRALPRHPRRHPHERDLRPHDAAGGAARAAQPQPGLRCRLTSPPAGWAPAGDLDLYYEIHGSGRPMLLLHGAFMTIDLMGPMVAGPGPDPAGDRRRAAGRTGTRRTPTGR